MNKDKKNQFRNMDDFETIAKILEHHSKNEDEIKEFLEYHFPISSAIMQQIIETRQREKKQK